MVTYGTAAASYLAAGCLQQLAHDEKEALPAAATLMFQNVMWVTLLMERSNEKWLLKRKNS